MLAFVFPGQGAQSVGMVAALAAEFPQVRARYEEASSVLGFDLWALVDAGPAEELNLTQNTQPALLAASVATWDVWLACGGPRPALMAGHSFGEYSALVCSDALAFRDAVGLVADRGRFMQEAVPAGSGGMAAVLGLDQPALAAACAAAAELGVAQCANLNAPGQIVISGAAAAVARAGELAKQAGAKRVVPLAVSVPAHSALMQPAAARFAARIAPIAINRPQIPVVHNVDVATHDAAEDIRAALVAQLHSPVRWQETIEHFAARGVTQVVECGPGKVLAPLVKRCAAGLEVHTLNGPAELRAALAGLGA
ncbi:MAG TPA: ACP S-malonyltransferase [Gammaproteobacteria bacterium]|nr:ACP S-malonyltransferase [Gammaproteobacteria bacterium]